MSELILEEGTYTARRNQDGNIVLRAVKEKFIMKLAEGHNPAQLTEVQVGVADGWRLLAEDEICDQIDRSELRHFRHGDWGALIGGGPLYGVNAYRTKKPVGHFRPAPAAFTVEHIDSVLTDLRLVERAISFGHPHEVIEQMICRYENLKLNA